MSYNSLIEKIQVTNTDNDLSSLVVSSDSASFKTSESGDSSVLKVKLSSKPYSDVSVSVLSSDASEGSVSKDVLLFTSNNWNIDQEVTVSGVDDEEFDNTVSYSVVFSVTSSLDSNYSQVESKSISFDNQDDDKEFDLVEIGVLSVKDIQETVTNGSNRLYTISDKSGYTGGGFNGHGYFRIYDISNIKTLSSSEVGNLQPIFSQDGYNCDYCLGSYPDEVHYNNNKIVLAGTKLRVYNVENDNIVFF